MNKKGFNHKVSTCVVLISIFLMLSVFVIGRLDSSDIDDVCGQNNSFLYREPNLNRWICANFTDVEINFTVNNVTNIINNASVTYEPTENSRDVDLGDFELTGDGLNIEESTGQGILFFKDSIGRNRASIFNDVSRRTLDFGRYLEGGGWNGYFARFNISTGLAQFFNNMEIFGDMNISGDTLIGGNLNMTNNTITDINELNVTSLNVGENARIGYSGDGVLDIITNLTDTKTFAQTITGNNRATGLIGALNFVINFPIDVVNGASAVILRGDIRFKNASSTHTAEGIVMKNLGAVSQTGGTRTLCNFRSNPTVPILGTGGNTIITSFHHEQNGAVAQLSGDQIVYIYGLRAESGSNAKLGGDGSIFDYGAHFEGYSTCTNCNESLAIKVVDGVSYFGDVINSTDINNSGTFETRGLSYLRDDTLIDGDLNVTGNFTGNQIYGGMTFHNDTTVGVLNVINTQGIYENITGFNQTEDSTQSLNGVDYDNDNEQLIIQVPGTYDIFISISTGNTGNNQEYQFGISINGVVYEFIDIHRKIGAAGDVGSGSDAFFVPNLQVGDNIKMVAKNLDGIADLNVHKATVKIDRVGD